LHQLGNAPVATPVDAVSLVRGDTIGGATVAYNGPDNFFTQVGTKATSACYYRVFAYNGSGTSINYKQATPLEGNVQLPADLIGAYYSSIDISDTAFVTALKSRIRSPYIKINYNQYDETVLTNVETQDAPGDQRAITCVYSGERVVFTPPFGWTPSTPFSREHTWCYSWMPTTGSTSTDEYADQHHLFPTNQDDANAAK
jgi:hypothetical protein